MDIPKSFVIQTEIMSQDRLDFYNLILNTTSLASDHFPMVADLNLPYAPVSIEETMDEFSVTPNPFRDSFKIKTKRDALSNYIIYQINGQVMKKGSVSSHSEIINASELRSGIYLIYINDKTHRIVKVD